MSQDAARRGPGYALRAALGLFTTLPARPLDTIDHGTARAAIAALPWVGLLLGIGSAGAYLIGALAGAPLLGAVLALVVLAWTTGALHLDGLADTADGLGSRRSTDRALDIMKQSDIGPMGVVALVLALLLEASSVAALDLRTAAVAVALGPLLGRLSIVLATVAAPPARPGGFGALVTRVTSRRSAVVQLVLAGALVLAVPWLVTGWRAATATACSAAAALLIAWAFRRSAQRRLGGVTGDVFGATSEVTQAAFWVLLIPLAALLGQ